MMRDAFRPRLAFGSYGPCACAARSRDLSRRPRHGQWRDPRDCGQMPPRRSRRRAGDFPVRQGIGGACRVCGGAAEGAGDPAALRRHGTVRFCAPGLADGAQRAGTGPGSEPGYPYNTGGIRGHAFCRRANSVGAGSLSAAGDAGAACASGRDIDARGLALGSFAAKCIWRRNTARFPHRGTGSLAGLAAMGRRSAGRHTGIAIRRPRGSPRAPAVAGGYAPPGASGLQRRRHLRLRCRAKIPARRGSRWSRPAPAPARRWVISRPPASGPKRTGRVFGFRLTRAIFSARSCRRSPISIPIRSSARKRPWCARGGKIICAC